MNRTETHDLLTFIAAYDNRRFDDATVLAWHAVLGGLPLADCRQAVVEHFGETDAYLMPVHIRRGAIALERDRRRAEREALEERDRLALEAEPGRRDRSDAVSDVIGRLRAMLPEGHPDKLRRPEWVELERRRERMARADAEPNPYYDRNAIFGGNPDA